MDSLRQVHDVRRARMLILHKTLEEAIAGAEMAIAEYKAARDIKNVPLKSQINISR